MAARLVSVILPCYNAADYVAEAMESILCQSYEHLEVLAIDDGSTDETLSLLERAARADPRVRVIVNPENLGLMRTLNRGVEEASGEYIARMDADDYSHPDRFRRQVSVLEERPDVDIVGVATELMDSAGNSLGQAPVRCVEPEAARFLSLFATPLVHPSILARTQVMRASPYSIEQDSLHTEDYELFSRLARRGVGLYNLDEPLHRLRIWAGSVSRRYEAIQVENFVHCARVHLEKMVPIEVSHSVHRALVNRLSGDVEARDLGAAVRVLDQLRDHFLAELAPDSPARHEVHRIADEQRADILLQAVLKGTAAQRGRAVLLSFKYCPSLLSGSSRAYLRAKITSKVASRVV